MDLDESGLTPHAHECLVRLSVWMPFGEAVEHLRAMLGVQISASTARRMCLQAGQAAEQVQREQAQPQGSSRFPLPQQEPTEQMVMSSDGGMVPLCGGAWAEVKTLVIGQVVPTRSPTDGATRSRSTAHSYFSRLSDAATFGDLASGEIRRRGIERAPAVCAVQDGARWLQGFVDGHRRDAVRILDFAHAAGYLGHIVEQAQQLGVHLPSCWLAVLLHQLKHHGPDRVLAHLQRLQPRLPLPAISDALRYFHGRLAQMQYPQFQAAGWPIGSGIVESANKLVVQARLKGAGMHWQPENVNPMLALRTVVVSDRWDEVWPLQEQAQRDNRSLQRRQHAELRWLHLVTQVTAQFLRLRVRESRPAPPPPPPTTKGPSPAQYRWGRRPFSPGGLRLHLAKL